MRVIAAVAFGVLLVQGCATEPPEIDRMEVEHIISTLASDEMKGRATFRPEIEQAAGFIAEQFAAAGLTPLEGEDDFRQAFTVFTTTQGGGIASINGLEIPEDRVGFLLSAETLDWPAGGDFNVVTVGADDDLRAIYFEARGSGEDQFLVVDPAHAELFQSIRRGLSRPARSMTPPAGNLVMALGDGAAVQSVSASGSASVEEIEIANVAGMIPGRRSDEIVLFSAHYDHIGVRPGVEGDSIANGANDDASGTTAVISLAKYFQQMGTPERTLMFAAFTGEESGGWGSRHFSGELNPDQIVAMFNIEMIGKPAVSGPNTAWITGFDRSTFGEILSQSVEGTEYSFYADPYPDQNLFYRSDNATLARLGVPAHSISTTPIDVDQDYHQVSDEVATLDLDHMTNTIKAIAAAATLIISGEATPTRVDPATVN